MPLSQREQYSDRKGTGLIKLGGVLCLTGFLFGSICFTIVATMGDGEDPPKLFEQMGGASCGVCALGLILGIVGWLISLNQPEPPKLTAASAGVEITVDEDDTPESVASDGANEEPDKPDLYKSEHRRREN
jgi:hypothetical protein